MADAYLQLATNGEWEHALALPLEPAAFGRVEQWLGANATHDEAAVEIVFESPRGPSTLGVRATGADLPRLRQAAAALLTERTVPSLHAAGVHLARAFGRPLFTTNGADALLLGAFNAWKSRGEVTLWERANGALDVTAVVDRAMASHLARSPSREPLLIEAVTRTPVQHWIGICASVVAAGQHVLTSRGVEAATHTALRSRVPSG
jgi:hypothetical protein